MIEEQIVEPMQEPAPKTFKELNAWMKSKGVDGFHITASGASEEAVVKEMFRVMNLPPEEFEEWHD